MLSKHLHRNSQKRFYGSDKIYFITTNTQQRFSYFSEDLFCRLFIENLKICKRLKEFLLYGFIIIPDHVHLLLEPKGKFNISEIMQYLKRHISRDINYVLGANNEGEIRESNNEGEIRESRLQDGNYAKFRNIIIFHDEQLKIIKNEFDVKYKDEKFNFPQFKWQQSFYDHVIRNEKDFYKHLNYIAANCIKHNLCEDEEKYKWSFLNPEFSDFIDEY